jgi:hypothetical protein
MSEQNSHISSIAGPEVLKKLLRSDEAHLVDTHGRYNLATTDDSCDMSQLNAETQTPERRFLVVPAQPIVGVVEAQLEEAKIPAFAPAALLDNHVVYKIPIGAKPLDKERFFPDRPSTVTYINDEELCATLGALWGNIYKSTKQLPMAAPLQHTAMLEFSGTDVQLLPIPPYDWSTIEQPAAAKEYFLDTMSEELLRPSSGYGGGIN